MQRVDTGRYRADRDEQAEPAEGVVAGIHELICGDEQVSEAE